jgi:outer membrane protein OmpA-like peptidoglycan-associated protein
MVHSNSLLRRFFAGTPVLAFALFMSMHSSPAADEAPAPFFSPVVNGEALRGLTATGSAESMGAGLITFNLFAPWYRQQRGYFSSPNAGANVFTGVGAFSYGVNSYVDLFTSIAGFSSNNYTNTEKSFGLGTIRAGVQGSLPFPQYAFIRVGGQAGFIGGTARNQINTNGADGYNYFETRTGYDLLGKLLQTFQFGGEDYGMKLHLNEGGVIGINKEDPSLLLLGAGLQANMGFAVLGAEINSRTQFNDVSFKTDPLWLTPSLHIRTPYSMNVMAGVDVSLSASRSNALPRALEPYRVFGGVAFSFDMLAGKRNAEFTAKQKAAKEKADMERDAALSANKVLALTEKSRVDSIANAGEKETARMQLDSMQTTAGVLAKKATSDSFSLAIAEVNLAEEKEKRSDAEKQLLSTGELLLNAVYFMTGKAAISINSKSYLNIIGKMLLKYPKLQIEVGGHTDNIGSQESNVTLSQGRAETVRNYLIEVAPALSTTLEAHGYGMSMPKADNTSKEGRLANRRVELRVKNMNALQEYSQMQ